MKTDYDLCMTRLIHQFNTGTSGHHHTHEDIFDASHMQKKIAKKMEAYGAHASALKKPILIGIILMASVVAMAFFLSSLRSDSNQNSILPAAVGGIPNASDMLAATPLSPAIVDAPFSHYIEIINGCGVAFDGGPCVNMRAGPSTDSAVVVRLRTGIVLKVEEKTVQGDGHDWYKIIFDGDIRYPERVKGDWYVAVDPASVRPFEDIGDINLTPGTAITTNKRIVVDLSKETLYAYDGDTLFMQELISTGLDSTPTPPGNFTVYKKTPSRYMQGPIPGVSDQYYDLPGVPWNLYFTKDGAVVHGAYWHNHFGEPWSHGCVNLPPQAAKKLYDWADIGTPVIVQN